MEFDVTPAPLVVRQGTSGGTPLGTSGRARLKLVNNPGEGGGYALIEGSHPPGEPRIRDHVHALHEETLVVLHGSYEVRLGHDIVTVSAGDYVFVPRGTPHTYRNAAGSLATILNIISPADGLGLLTDLGALAGRSVDEELLAQIHARHGARLVGPLPNW